MSDLDVKFYSGQPKRWSVPDIDSDISTQRYNHPIQLPRYGRMPLNWRARDIDNGYHNPVIRTQTTYQSTLPTHPSRVDAESDLQQQPSAESVTTTSSSAPVFIQTVPAESYAGSIVFACIVFVCCNVLFGAVALALAGNLQHESIVRFELPSILHSQGRGMLRKMQTKLIGLCVLRPVYEVVLTAA
jgi:hypothetical protein